MSGLSSKVDCKLHHHRVEEHEMPFLNLVVTLVIFGVILYLINRYIPMAGSIKTVLNVVVVVVVCIWILQSTGLWGSVSNYGLQP
jgi:hypothetical protein